MLAATGYDLIKSGLQFFPDSISPNWLRHGLCSGFADHQISATVYQNAHIHPIRALPHSPGYLLVSVPEIKKKFMRREEYLKCDSFST
jgi:hypothetical protein